MRRVVNVAGQVIGENRLVVISSPFVIILSAAEEAVLSARAGSARAQHRMVIRAKIVLAAAQGHTNAAIAAELGMHIDTVRKWRRRFCEHGIGGLADRARSGRPPRFTPVQVAEVKALACTLPAESGLPLSRWSSEARWLNSDAIKPWQHRSWIFPRDPEFAAKAA